MIKNFSKLGIEGNFLNLVMDICKKHTASIILKGELLKAFLWTRSETGKPYRSKVL